MDKYKNNTEMQETYALKAKNEELLCRLKEALTQVEETKNQYKEEHKIKLDLEKKIEFLEGQIEAYQYCMNCRR